MAQYDLLLVQNIHASGIEFSENFVNISKGSLLTANASNVPISLGIGTNGHVLMADSATASGLKWEPLAAGHTQNTDIGTTAVSFQIDSGNAGPRIKNNSGVMEVRNGADNAYAQLTADKVVVGSADPTGAYELTHKTYVDNLLGANDAMVFKGVIACNTNPNYPAADAGHTYKVSVAGKIGGASGPNVEVGDMLICITDDTASGTHAAVGADWNIIQVNIDGAVIGPVSATDGRFAIFDGTSGKLLKNGAGAPGTMAYETATNYMLNSVFGAHSVAIAITASTPVALTVAASTVVGRAASGNIVALTATQLRTIINVADGATANSKATAAEINTGTDDVKFATPAAIAGSRIVFGPAAAVVNERIAVFDGTTGKLLKDGGKTAAGIMNTWVSAPATKTSTGTVGAIAYDANYIYVCTATNIWKRAAISTNW